jgi:hypothetical protein
MNRRAQSALVAAMVTAFGWGIAQPAHAMGTYVDHDTVVIAAAPGETNLLTVLPHPTQIGAFVIADPGATITAGAGCIGTPLGKVAICSVAAEYIYEPSVTLSLGDGSDRASVEAAIFTLEADGGSGDDALDIPGTGGNGGSTYVELGGGNDTLHVDGSYSSRMQVYGGDGDDSIDASGQDGGSYYGEGGDDSITASGLVSGGDGADTLVGGSQGTGHYLGGGGNDSINTDDTEYDLVDCGLGTDGVMHDEFDDVSGCETFG